MPPLAHRSCRFADLAVEEVDPVDAEAEALALAKPGAGREHNKRPVAVRTGVRHFLDLGGGQRHDLPVLSFWQSDAVARNAPISWSPTAALKMAATHR